MVTSAAHDLAPRVTLARVLDDLGSTFLRAATPVYAPDQPVGGITIHDPLDDQAIASGGVVLGVAVADGLAIRSLIADVGPRGAGALVLREPVSLDGETESLAAEHRVAVLALTRGASWAQLATLLRSILLEGEQSPPPDGDGLERLQTGDLFTLANAIAALIDAPVTIEDRSSRVLAFSGRQDEADQSRIETILDRRVPERYAQLLTDAGFFKRLYSSTVPVYIDLQQGDQTFRTRAAIAVRAGDEVLGSIWAAVREPLNAERSAALTDAAKVVALQLLRIRAGSDAERRLRADLLGNALEGGDRAAEALTRLGLGQAQVVVLALAAAGDPDREGVDVVSLREADRQRLGDAVAMHLAAVHPRACSALLGGTVYGLLPVRDAAGGASTARRLAEDFIARLGRQATAHVAVGPVAQGSADLPAARRDVDRTLRVLQSHAGAARVATSDDVQVEALLLDLRDAVAGRGEFARGPLARLRDHDHEQGSDLLLTLGTWLDTMGDVTSAATRLHIHPNTFRYRLRRLAEVSGLDLQDPEARFAAMLQLRVIPDLAVRPPG